MRTKLRERKIMRSLTPLLAETLAFNKNQLENQPNMSNKLEHRTAIGEATGYLWPINMLVNIADFMHKNFNLYLHFAHWNTSKSAFRCSFMR